MSKQKLLIGITLLLTQSFLPSSLRAQNVNFEVIDTGVLNHSVHGQGIEMRLKPIDLPKDGWKKEVLEPILKPLCVHYAAQVIPFVLEKTGITDPKFVAVRLVSGGTFGQYILQAFEIENGGCGSKID